MNQYPRIHNAMWPGLVGKGPGSEPFIDLETMLDLTAAAEVDGERFDGVDLFLADPHTSIDSTKDDVRHLAEQVSRRDLLIGSVVAPVWAPTGGGSSMGSPEEKERFLTQIRKACGIAQELRASGIRRYGVVRIDSSVDPATWASDPQATDKIAAVFREACAIAEDHGEMLAAEGEICWGGMHSCREMLRLLETVGRPDRLGFQADLAHTLLYVQSPNASKDALLPADFDWQERGQLENALRKIANALRPWTIDFHVAQNDGTVKGSGSHDKTGKHCLPNDPNGRLDVVQAAGYWLRDEQGHLLKRVAHICWDGCMFSNSTMLNPATWREILATMIHVRRAHGWFQEEEKIEMPVHRSAA